MEDFYRIRLSALDNFDLPVARFDRAGALTWMNGAAQRLLGRPHPDGISLRTLFPDERQYGEVMQQLTLRLQGAATDYEAAFQRPFAPPDEPPIPVRIWGFPETDEAGEVAGSVAMLRDLREERACRAMHQAIETVSDNRALFATMAAEIRKLIPCDEVRVSSVNPGRTHLRRMYSTDGKADAKHPRRWWQMPPWLRATLQEYRAGVLRVAELLTQPGFQVLLETDEGFRRYYAADVRETQLLPIVHDNVIVAFVALDGRRDGMFDERTVALLGRLPIAETVMAALHREERRRQMTTLELIRRMSTMASDMREAALHLVACLAQEFGWEHVSMFQVEDDPPAVRLVCQADGGLGALPYPLCLETTGAGAALAGAVHGGRPVAYSTSREHSPFAHQAGGDLRGSQLIVPIRGRHTTLALNIECRLADAFSPEDIALLENIAREAGEVLQRASLFELQQAALGAITDAVIETGRDGTIRWCNAAARQMLQIDVHQQRLAIDALLGDGSGADALRTAESFSRREITLRTTSGGTVPAILSCSTLPKHLGGRVYVATDYTYQRELQRQGALKEVFRHAAMEGRIPLSLAATWLERLPAQDGATRDTIDKVLGQLARADLPLERLLRLFSTPPEAEGDRYADVGRAVEQTLRELPCSVAGDIESSTSAETLPVAADFNHVQFCVESMLAFGLRTRPQSRTLHVETGIEDGKAVVRVHGEWKPESGLEEGGAERWRRKALYDLTLGEPVLQNVALRAGGKFRADFRNALTMALELPLRP